MTSRSQGPHKPLKKITLRFEVEAGAEELAALQRSISGAHVSKGRLTVSRTTTRPEEAIEGLRETGTAIRNMGKRPEGFK